MKTTGAPQHPAQGVLHAADRLIEAIERVGAPVCVGLDPVVEKLPSSLRLRGGNAADPASSAAAIEAFCLGVLDAVAAVVPCVKPQSACFERYRSHGVAALDRVIAAAHSRGLQVILDAKRGDIGSTADHYAAAAFGAAPGASVGAASTSDPRPDWMTVNSYLGSDSIQPFLRDGFGAFVLVRTSNPGGDELQGRQLKGGATADETVADAVAGLVARLGKDRVGRHGYSDLGAVVGATKPQDAERLRRLMPQQIFLVPGYGAQGASAKDVLPCFSAGGRGRGAVVNASRSVIFAFEPDSGNWVGEVAEAAKRFANDIGAVVGLR